jgi:hypothetical protein
MLRITQQKKGLNAIGIIGTAIIVLFLVYIVISISKKGITDAGDSFTNLLNLNTANCDHDFDGIKDKDDLCPCDSDDYYDSNIFYISDQTTCQVMRRCSLDSTLTRISECDAKSAASNTQLTSKTDLISYYINLKVKACKSWYDSKGKTVMSQTYSTECKGYTENSTEVAFPQACADKILAWNKDKNRSTFTCKTPTKTCGDILKKEC